MNIGIEICPGKIPVNNQKAFKALPCSCNAEKKKKLSQAKYNPLFCFVLY